MVWKVVTPAAMVSIVADNAAALRGEEAKQEQAQVNEHNSASQKQTLEKASSSQSMEVGTDAVPEREQEKADRSKQIL